MLWNHLGIESIGHVNLRIQLLDWQWGPVCPTTWIQAPTPSCQQGHRKNVRQEKPIYLSQTPASEPLQGWAELLGTGILSHDLSRDHMTIMILILMLLMSVVFPLSLLHFNKTFLNLKKKSGCQGTTGGQGEKDHCLSSSFIHRSWFEDIVNLNVRQ